MNSLVEIIKYNNIIDEIHLNIIKNYIEQINNLSILNCSICSSDRDKLVLDNLTNDFLENKKNVEISDIIFIDVYIPIKYNNTIVNNILYIIYYLGVTNKIYNNNSLINLTNETNILI